MLSQIKLYALAVHVAKIVVELIYMHMYDRAGSDLPCLCSFFIPIVSYKSFCVIEQ